MIMDDIIDALDAIHARMEQGEDCYNDIGCLIAKLKGDDDRAEEDDARERYYLSNRSY
jgi:hypothetical protein